jgi:hypothetical protein
MREEKFKVVDKRFLDFAFKFIVEDKQPFYGLCKHVVGGQSTLYRWQKTYIKVAELSEYSKNNYSRKKKFCMYDLRAKPAPEDLISKVYFETRKQRLPRLVE